MDFEQDNNQSGYPSGGAMPPLGGNMQPSVEPPSKRSGWGIFWGVILALSLLANFVLFITLIGLAAVFATGHRGLYTEDVIQEGPRTSKIAVINLEGVIGGDQSKDFDKQLKWARDDNHIKGLIIRINSPGGGISSSDEIHNKILKYREETGKPVVAFMKGIAASGGYYASVACDKIVAEPTTITGSIGVIMGHFVLQKLLEDKLGIQPVIIESGPKKDWPSLFKPVTDEQRQYLQQKLIRPAYERFVKIVADGRKELTLADVRRLADGSIYSADEALQEKLIDKIGYLDEAIEQVKDLTGAEEAQVVEYRKAFSIYDFLNSRTSALLRIDRSTLYEFYTPQVMYLWSGLR